MSEGVNRTNHWAQQVRYFKRSSAQSFLNNTNVYELKTSTVIGSDCSCNCYGGCSGGSCSSCSYENS